MRDLQAEYEKGEEDLKALQSVGQVVGEVLRPLDDERIIVKASSGPRYIVGCRRQVDRARLKADTRVALDITTLTVMRYCAAVTLPLRLRALRAMTCAYARAPAVCCRGRWTRWSTTCRLSRQPPCGTMKSAV